MRTSAHTYQFSSSLWASTLDHYTVSALRSWSRLDLCLQRRQKESRPSRCRPPHLLTLHPATAGRIWLTVFTVKIALYVISRLHKFQYAFGVHSRLLSDNNNIKRPKPCHTTATSNGKYGSLFSHSFITGWRLSSSVTLHGGTYAT